MDDVLAELGTLRDRIGIHVDRLQNASALGLSATKEVSRILGHLKLACKYLDQIEVQEEADGSLFPDLQQTLSRALRQQLTESGPTEPVGQGEVPTSEPEASMQGDTRCFNMPELIGYLSMQSKDGVLEVRAPDETIRVVLERGNIVQAYSDNCPDGEKLGDMLVQIGAISAEDLSSFLLLHAWSKSRLGEALQKEELVSQEALARALELQIVLLIRRLFSKPYAEFSFTEGVPDDLTRELNLNATQLLLESARQCDEAGSGTEDAPGPPEQLPTA